MDSPSAESVKQIKKYVEKLPAKSPYIRLAEYEQQLVDAGEHTRALARVCAGDAHDLINKLEGLRNKNWLRISNITDVKDIPDNYLNVVLWSDCDLESDLRRVEEMYPKLKPGARVYFNNLLTGFIQVLKKCLSKQEVQTLVGKKPSPSLEYAQLVKSILGTALEKYTVQILRHGNVYYLVLIKRLLFEPTEALAVELEKVDEAVTKKFPPKPTLELSAEQLAKIRNRIFDLVAAAVIENDPNKSSYVVICKQLVDEKLLPDCLIKGPHEEFLSKNYLGRVWEAVEEVNTELEALILATEEPTVDALVEGLGDGEAYDLELVDEKHWHRYVRKVASAKIEELVTTEEEPTEPEEEYPTIPEPEEPLPAVLLPALANVGGFSCFMDSVLFAILLPKDGYIERSLLQKKLTIANVQACSYFEGKEKEGLAYLEGFQSELKKLAAIIRGKQEPAATCYPIVSKMRKCNPFIKELMSGEQQDDSEFLRGLMQMFALEPTRVTVTRQVSNDGKEWIPIKVEKKQPQAILEVHAPEHVKEIPELASWYQRVQVNNYQDLAKSGWPKGPDDQPYQYLQEKHTIDSAEAIIFHISRVQQRWVDGKLVLVKNTREIAFNEYLEHKPDQRLALRTVTIHRGGAKGGHYMAYFKYGPQWFYYDDMASPISRVRPATFEEVRKEGSTNGSLFMYYLVS